MCYIPKVYSERITDTVTYVPASIPIQQFTANGHLLQADDSILLISHITQMPSPRVKTKLMLNTFIPVPAPQPTMSIMT